MTTNETKRYTISDFEKTPEGWRGELIDGELIALASPSLSHQRITLELAFQFRLFAQKSGHDCEVFSSPVDVQLSESKDVILEPDVVVLCDPEKARVQRIVGAPDFVAEVLSPSTRSRDMVLKTALYMENGVREYWIIDESSREVLIYDFERDRLLERRSFDERIPVGITDGELEIDLSRF